MNDAFLLPSGFDSPEHFLSAIIDSSDDAIITKDLQGNVTSWNRGAERMFGYTAKEMIGQSTLILIPKDRQEEERLILERLSKSERLDHFETKRRRKDGKIIDVSLSVSPVKNSAGAVVGTSKIARDITTQTLAMQSIALAAQETARQNRMKDEFLTTLSHELRTPLQSIVGWVQLLRQGDLVSGELEEGLEVIDRNARVQQHIIEDLLDMNSILSGKVKLQVETVAVPAVIEAALATVRTAAKAKDIDLRVVLDPMSDPMVADPRRLQQIVWNLLTNAIKFTPRGGEVEIAMRRDHSDLAISVTDTGMGISSEFLPFVFDRFRQADSSISRSYSGLGLGLALVKHLVELHGGTVKAGSPGPNLGAVFTVRLPLGPARDRASAGSSDEAALQASPAMPRLHDVSVLVVDDDEDSRTLVARALSKSGALVRTAASAEDGLGLIDESLPDVLVSDIGMPGTNGFTMMETLRARPVEQGGKIPAVALTAYAGVEDSVRALCAGFQILLPKPADTAKLLATVSALAQQAKQRPGG